MTLLYRRSRAHLEIICRQAQILGLEFLDPSVIDDGGNSNGSAVLQRNARSCLCGAEGLDGDHECLADGGIHRCEALPTRGALHARPRAEVARGPRALGRSSGAVRGLRASAASGEPCGQRFATRANLPTNSVAWSREKVASFARARLQLERRAASEHRRYARYGF